MNKILREFLEKLSEQDADEIWEYLDGNQNCREEMIMVIVDFHPELEER